MAGFVEGVDRGQNTLFPALLEDYVAEDNPVRAVDVFVDGLDFDKLGFVGVQALDTGRPGYHPRTMLKLYIYGYLNRIPLSRCLERECQRNIEMIWLTRQLAPSRTSRLSRTSARTMAGAFPEFVALCFAVHGCEHVGHDARRDRVTSFENEADCSPSECESCLGSSAFRPPYHMNLQISHPILDISI